MPLGRAGVPLVGIDRSGRDAGARASARGARASRAGTSRLVRGDIRALPFPAAAFSLVMAPYGVLQSLLRERDLAATLRCRASGAAPGGTFGVELVADLPSWDEYRKRVSLKGWKNRRGGAHVTLVETVRQDRARHLTIFDQEFTERIGRSAGIAALRADVPDALGAPDGPPAREGRLRDHGAARRLSRRRRGMHAAEVVDYPRPPSDVATRTIW